MRFQYECSVSLGHLFWEHGVLLSYHVFVILFLSCRWDAGPELEVELEKDIVCGRE